MACSKLGFVFALSVSNAVVSACTSTVVSDRSDSANGNAGVSMSSHAPAQGGNQVKQSRAASGAQQSSGGTTSPDPAGASSEGSAGGTTGSGTTEAGGAHEGGSNSGGTTTTNSSSELGTARGGNSTLASGGSSATGGTKNVGGGSTNGGTVSTNGGTVSTNGGTISANGGTISANGGTISANGGTISANGGTVSTNGGTGASTTVALGGCSLSKPFGAWRQILMGTADSSEHSLSVDEKGRSAIVAVRSRVTDPSSSYDLKRYSRDSLANDFANEANILGTENVNTAANEFQPRLSRDGLTLFFTRSSADGTAIYWTVRQGITNFPVPTAMGATINIATDAGGAFIAGDGSYFYWIAGAQVYRAEVSSGYKTTLLLANVSSVGPSSAVVVTDDQLTLYVSSKGKAPSAFAYEQVWKAVRSSSSSLWSVPTLVEELRDVTQHTYVQDVSPDGCNLYASKTASSVYRLYQASRPR